MDVETLAWVHDALALQVVEYILFHCTLAILDSLDACRTIGETGVVWHLTCGNHTDFQKKLAEYLPFCHKM